MKKTIFYNFYMELKELKTKPKTEVNDIINQLYWSENESKVIEYSLKGYSVIQIADKLWVSTRTINRLRKSINTKLKTLY